MNEKITNLLDEVIENEIKEISSIASRDEKSKAINDLAKLHNLRIEENKLSVDSNDKSIRSTEIKKDRYFRLCIATAEIVLPLMFYGVWYTKGLKFEETGTYTSTTFKNLFNRFRPTK